MAGSNDVLRPAPGTLTGDRVIVRGYLDGDAEALFAAIRESVEHLRPWFPWPDAHRSVEDTLAYIRQTQAAYILRQRFEMGIFSPNGRFLGGCALHVEDWDVPALMIGYWIRQTEEGKGYVTEAVKLLTQCAFGPLGAERVHIFCDAQNRRSAAVAERLGYVFERTSRRAARNTAGALSDVLHYSLLRDEYEARVF